MNLRQYTSLSSHRWVSGMCAAVAGVGLAALLISQPAAAASEKIGIIGAGSVGQTLAQLWIKSGHPVMISSRHPDEIASTAKSLGAKAGTPEQAARYGDVVVTAVPFGALPAVGKAEGKLLANKVVIDPSNPYPERDGKLANQAIASSSGEVSAKALGTKHLVRAFNTLAMGTLTARAGGDDPVGIPLASDDQHAIEVASQLIKDAGFVPVVAGGLSSSHLFDPSSSVFLSPLSPEKLKAAMNQ